VPIAVDADQAIEWHQEQKAYAARGNAKAVRGNTTLTADVLVAYYREAPGGGTQIYRLAADGNVHIVSPEQEVFGDRGVYDIDQKVAVVTGKNLKLITKTDVVTARDSLEYWEDQHLTVARGDAVAVRNENKLRGDVLVGLLVDDGQGGMKMQRLDADGNVVVTTPTDIVRGRHGIYNLVTDIATLTGDVKLTKGDNQLNGDSAEVNMKTGISRVLTQANKPGERVHGLFLPGQDTDKQGKPGAPAPAGAMATAPLKAPEPRKTP